MCLLAVPRPTSPTPRPTPPHPTYPTPSHLPVGALIHVHSVNPCALLCSHLERSSVVVPLLPSLSLQLLVTFSSCTGCRLALPYPLLFLAPPPLFRHKAAHRSPPSPNGT